MDTTPAEKIDKGKGRQVEMLEVEDEDARQERMRTSRPFSTCSSFPCANEADAGVHCCLLYTLCLYPD